VRNLVFLLPVVKTGPGAARRKRTGTSEPVAGWIRQITVTHSPRFAPNSVLGLQKATVMTSKHSVGKTALNGVDIGRQHRHDA
jgi:hypothetical protein